ncbi:hypothetical protein HY636_03880 [Candidatus Woesearchaeota archaeon]|nr:hypothetical protein [Candidatus Woesearchaeota archaeon]
MYNSTAYLWTKVPESFKLLTMLVTGPRIYFSESIRDFIEEKDKVGGTIALPFVPFPDTWIGKYAVLFAQPVTFYKKDKDIGIISDQKSDLEVKLDYDWNCLSIPAVDTYVEENMKLTSGLMLENVFIGYRKRDHYTWLMMYDLIGEADTVSESSLSPICVSFFNEMRNFI